MKNGFFMQNRNKIVSIVLDLIYVLDDFFTFTCTLCIKCTLKNQNNCQTVLHVEIVVLFILKVISSVVYYSVHNCSNWEKGKIIKTLPELRS